MSLIVTAMAITLGLAGGDGGLEFRSWIVSSNTIGVLAVGQGDLDGDGDIDVLSSDWERISWYENDGSQPPAFAQRTIADAPGTAGWGTFLVDLDGDGDLDVLSVTPQTETLGWYENDGRDLPAFVFHTIAADLLDVSCVKATDFDSDTDIDVIVAAVFGGQHHIVLFLSDGGNLPSFESQVISTTIDICESTTHEAMVASDLDADGDMDIVGASGVDGAIAWYESDGRRPLAFTERIISADPARPVTIFVTDLDDDLDMDVLTAEHDDDSLVWYSNDGGRLPTFVERRVIADDESNVFAVSAADMDGDGDMDVLSGRDTDTLTWHENDGATPPQFTRHIVDTAWGPPFGVLAADLDGDGDLDILSTGTLDDRVQWYENGGEPELPFTQHVIALDESDPQPVAVVDIDGDGDNDFLARSDLPNNLGDIVAWWENNGAKEPSFELRVISSNALDVQSVAHADMDGDGDIDVISASEDDDKVAWYEQVRTEGEQKVAFIEHVITDVAFFATDVVSADLDNDGDVDLVVSSVGNYLISWFDNDGKQPPSFTVRPVSDFVFADDLFTADVDGDGDIDVLSASGFEGVLAWYENDGQAPPSFTIHFLPYTGAEPESVRTADVDGDGDTDILAGSNFFIDDLNWCENIGGKPPQFVAHIVHTSGGDVGASADVDGDGDIDLLTSSDWYEQSRGTPVAFTRRRFEHMLNDGIAEMFPTGDIDGDGDIDLLASFVIADTVSWFENQGVTIVAATSIRSHQVAELAIDLFAANGIEPRQGGPKRLRFQTSDPLDAKTVTTTSVTMRCAGQSVSHEVTPITADTFEVELTDEIPDQTCCIIHFAGLRSTHRLPVTSPFTLRALEGDLNVDGAVTGGDALLIKPHFGEQATIDLAASQWDFNRDGAVTGADFALIKTRFGHVAADCD